MTPEQPRKRKNARACGARFELACVKDAQAKGITATKRLMSGQLDGLGDIELTTGWGEQWDGECKWKKALPKWIEAALQGRKFAVIKESRGEPYALIRYCDLLDLLQCQ